MANWHLDELLVEMIGAGWKRAKALPCPHDGIAGIWQMIQPSTNKVAFIEFHVQHNEVEEDPNEILHSYGCAVRYNPNIALHFYRKRPQWDRHLKQFVSEMDELESRVDGRDVGPDELACLVEEGKAQGDKLKTRKKQLVKTA
jgi:hypothetical protein